MEIMQSLDILSLSSKEFHLTPWKIVILDNSDENMVGACLETFALGLS
jgi:hypothetical protein